MSNTLVIRVLATTEFATGAKAVMWVACDDHGEDFSNTMSVESFAASYPTEQDLILNVLQSEAFEGAVEFSCDGSYELDACDGIYVEGFAAFQLYYMQVSG